MNQRYGMTKVIEPTGRIVIAGGTGLRGLNLARHLGEFDCEVILLSRHRPAEEYRRQHVTWDALTLGDWVSLLDGAAALVNLTGQTVDCVKTPDGTVKLTEPSRDSPQNDRSPAIPQQTHVTSLQSTKAQARRSR